MTHSLTLGSLLLTESLPDATHDFRFDVLAEGVGFGVAAGVKEVVTSLLSDGDLTRTTRYGNREVSFVVEIAGPDLASLAHGEAALRREVGRGNTLTWQPPDEFAVPTVFEVVDSEMVQRFDDLDELGRRRKFTLTLTCGPFARSKDLVTIDALASGTTTTSVDTCDSATGWSATRAGASSSVNTFIAGSVGTSEFDAEVSSPETFTLTRTGTIDFTTTPYLVAEILTVSYAQGLRVSATAGGVVLPILESRMLTDDSDFHRVTFDARAVGSVPSITFTHTSLAGEPWQGIHVRQVSRSDVAPGVTSRQTARRIEIGGTERTPASFHVEATTGVDGHGGLTILHTSPEDGSGYSPSLRRWRTDSGSTGPEYANASTLSGKWEDINYVAGGFNATVPTSALPEGGYVLMVRVRSATADLNTGRLYWSTSTLMGDSIEQQGYTNGSIPIALGSTPLVLPVAALSLPSVRTTNGKVEVVLQAITGGAQIQLDDAWLFRADEDCALTIVDNYQVNMWVDSPDVSSPVPRVWIGASSGGRNHPGTALQAMGNHVLHPNGTAVWAASLSDNPATRATAYRRWHSNAAS